VLIAVVALVYSARQVQLMRRQNLLPVALDFFREAREDRVGGPRRFAYRAVVRVDVKVGADFIFPFVAMRLNG